MEEVEDIITLELLREAKKIQTILGMSSFGQIFAYLEASKDHPNRFDFVLELFLAKQKKSQENHKPEVVIIEDKQAGQEKIKVCEVEPLISNKSVKEKPKGKRKKKSHYITRTCEDSVDTKVLNKNEGDLITTELNELTQIFPSIDTLVLETHYMELLPTEGKNTLNVIIETLQAHQPQNDLNIFSRDSRINGDFGVLDLVAGGNTSQPGTGSPRPSTSRYPGPCTSRDPGPSTSKDPGPSISRYPGPSTSRDPGPSTSRNAGPSTSQNSGSSTSRKTLDFGMNCGGTDNELLGDSLTGSVIYTEDLLIAHELQVQNEMETELRIARALQMEEKNKTQRSEVEEYFTARALVFEEEIKRKRLEMEDRLFTRVLEIEEENERKQLEAECLLLVQKLQMEEENERQRLEMEDRLFAQAIENEKEEEMQRITTMQVYLATLLPDADPTYLQQKCTELNNNAAEIAAFANEALEKKDYPSLADYLKREKEKQQLEKFTGRLGVQEFLQVFPNPDAHFRNKDLQGDKDYMTLCLQYLMSRYSVLPERDIRTCMKNHRNLTVMVEELEKSARQQVQEPLQPQREAFVVNNKCKHLHFMQEIIFIEKRAEIAFYQRDQAELKQLKVEEARFRDELLLCPICMDDECLMTDMSACPDGHLFCKACIRSHAEVGVGAAKTAILCLNENCKEEMSLQLIQELLPPDQFMFLLRRRQHAELEAAAIEGFETCPFCEYGHIPSSGDKIFRCLNSNCLQESCRNCRKPNHIPFQCGELERQAELDEARKFVENRMSDALIRKCWQCKKAFIRTDGCNRMTCVCGAAMCYFCRKPLSGIYQHASCGNVNHAAEVQQGAQRAVQEVQTKNPNIDISKLPRS